ncbi:hypothetical protein J437_LFUL018122 [Ladona fulva]|uniref:PiggyBac transposable element-derived protein domain-containing protein n=1 Tax=Ladona fulva TaxID=123851 RepID=A0A8K0KUY8_LADFU|nr:hypothetical protein J437_LFUL018122 [Ladona fulva]
MDNFHEKYRPEKELVIDEALVAFMGRHHIKQYIKNKPTKWRFMIWVFATPHGYVLRMNKGMLLRSQVVINLLDEYLGLHHHVYFDSFFSSVNLVRCLLQNKIYVCATSQPSCKEWPTQLKMIKSFTLKRGEFKYFQSSGVTATVWCDNSVLRKTDNGNERLAISCPISIVNYTKFMGGVDRADQKQSYYSLGRKTKKMYLFGNFINTAINLLEQYISLRHPHYGHSCSFPKGNEGTQATSLLLLNNATHPAKLAPSLSLIPQPGNLHSLKECSAPVHSKLSIKNSGTPLLTPEPKPEWETASAAPNGNPSSRQAT